MQSSECDKRIKSFTRPPYFITLLNFKCGCILNGSTVEPRYNEPLYNEVLRMTNDFFIPVTAKWMKKNLDITKPRPNEQILPVHRLFVMSRFHCTN